MTLPSRGPSSSCQLASGSCGDPPDDAQDLKAIAPFIVKHVPLLRMLEENHRRENRVVAEEHPEARILNAQIAKLTSSVYSGEVTLDANRYRSAHHAVKASIAAARAAAEDQRAEAMRRHIANVKQARPPTHWGHPPTNPQPPIHCHSPAHSPSGWASGEWMGGCGLVGGWVDGPASRWRCAASWPQLVDRRPLPRLLQCGPSPHDAPSCTGWRHG